MLFWKDVESEFTVTMITHQWWLPLRCFGERRKNSTKLLLKASSREKGWKENLSWSCPWKGQSTKIQEQRQEAQGKKSGAASAVGSQGTGIALPLVHFLAVILLIVAHTLKNYLVNTSFKIHHLCAWWNVTNSKENDSWNTFPFICKALNHLAVFSFCSEECSYAVCKYVHMMSWRAVKVFRFHQVCKCF